MTLYEIILALPNGAALQPGKVHSLVYQEMGCGGERPRDFIFRAETHPRDHVTIRSASFPERYRPHQRPVLTGEQGSEYNFYLKAAPLFSIGDGKRRAPRLVDFDGTPNPDLLRWLWSHADNAGFEMVGHVEAIPMRRYIEEKAAGIVECAYIGRLKITNIALFHNTLSKGLGRRRAYGYGLLSISEG